VKPCPGRVSGQTGPAAQKLKHRACCRNAFGQLLQCGLLRARLVAATVALAFARDRSLARKPVVSELGSKRFHTTPRRWITLSVLAIPKQVTCHAIVDRAPARLTRAFAVSNGGIAAAVAHHKLPRRRATVAISRRLLLNLCYLH